MGRGGGKVRQARGRMGPTGALDVDVEDGSAWYAWRKRGGRTGKHGIGERATERDVERRTISTQERKFVLDHNETDADVRPSGRTKRKTYRQGSHRPPSMPPKTPKRARTRSRGAETATTPKHVRCLSPTWLDPRRLPILPCPRSWTGKGVSPRCPCSCP